MYVDGKKKVPSPVNDFFPQLFLSVLLASE